MWNTEKTEKPLLLAVSDDNTDVFEKEAEQIRITFLLTVTLGKLYEQTSHLNLHSYMLKGWSSTGMYR